VPIEVIGSLTLIFVVAATLLLVSNRYSLPAIPFYLVAGILVGVVITEEPLLDLAQWGIAFLVFLFGIDLEPGELRTVGRDGTIVATIQLSITGGLFYLIGLGLGLGPLNAFYLAVAAALSSSLVSLSHLEKRIRPRVTHERLGETIHFVEDLVAIAIILGLSAFVYSPEPAWLQLTSGVGLLVAGVLVRRYLFDRIAGLAADAEILMLVAISFIIGFVALTELFEVSIVVGAFAAGIAVAREFPYDLEMVDAVEDLEDFFSPVFFVTLGTLVAIPTLGTAVFSLVLAVAVVLVNPTITALALVWRGYDPRTATLTGVNLDQVSEFTLIIAIGAIAAGTMAEALFEAIIFTAVLSMILSAYTSQYGEEIHRFVVERGLLTSDREKIDERSHVEEELTNHVIIVGYGTEGKEVALACEAVDRDYVVIENDPLLAEEIGGDVDNYAFGDVMGEAVWETARADRAALIVSTLVQEERSARVLELDIDADVIVRATDESAAEELFDRGALYVAVPDILAAERLTEQVGKVLEDEEYSEKLRERSRDRIDSARRPD
jgi:monovalent cation:H+ antiporter-2, CPA2 family